MATGCALGRATLSVTKRERRGIRVSGDAAARHQRTSAVPRTQGALHRGNRQPAARLRYHRRMVIGDVELPCAVCQQSTIHRPRPGDGLPVCQLCAYRFAQSKQPAPRGRYVKVKLSVLVLAAILVAVVGAVHIVHGGGVGLTVCAKDGWALSDTFVDLDDFIGKPLLSQIDRAKVLRAMFACGTLRRPGDVGDDATPRGRAASMFGGSKVTTTRIKLIQYANEAFPQWSASHPDKACPRQDHRSQRVHELERRQRLVGQADQDALRPEPAGRRQGPRRDVGG